MNISALYYDYQEKAGEQNNNLNNFVAASLRYIVGHYFFNWSSYFGLILCCRNNYSCSFYNEILGKMFAEWQEWPLQIVVVNNNYHPEDQNVYQYNMIFTDSSESFLKMDIHINAGKYDRNEYYFIYLHTPDHLIYGEMQKIFVYCWQHHLINCVVQIQKETGQIMIFTYFPFTEKLCGQVKAALVNEFNGTSLLQEELFPKKLKNFYGCPLRISLRHVPPYIYLSKDSNNKSYISGGFEGTLLLEISKKLNFSLDLIIPQNDNRMTVVNKTFKLLGVLKSLPEHKADLSVGALRQTLENMMLLTPTIYHYQSTWVIVALIDAYTLNSLETLMFPFSSNVWYSLALIAICTVGVVTLLRLKLPKYLRKHVDYILLDVLSVALGMSAFYKPTFNTTRILKVNWIIFSLVLRTIYGALLFHLIRSHVTRNMPQTFQDLEKQNYTLIVDNHTYASLQGMALFDNIKLNRLNTTSRRYTLTYLEKQPSDKARHMAVALPLTRFQYYIQTNKKTNVYKVLPQNIINIKLCMYLQKHSFLIEQFDDILMMIKGFGIIRLWLNKYIDVDYINYRKSEQVVFGLKKLKTVFILLLIGHLIASVAFIMELLYKRFKTFRTA